MLCGACLSEQYVFKQKISHLEERQLVDKYGTRQMYHHGGVSLHERAVSDEAQLVHRVRDQTVLRDWGIHSSNNCVLSVHYFSALSNLKNFHPLFCLL